MSSSPLTSLTRNKCHLCHRTFSRTEHLKRHELTHSKRRQYNCDECGKEFLRKDALDRHQITHEITGPNLLERGGRACLSCATAKVRCSGDLPSCSRCRSRATLPCRYPSSAMPVSSVLQNHDHNALDTQNMSFTALSNNDMHATGISPQPQMSLVDQSVDTVPQDLPVAHFSDRVSEWNAQTTMNWLSNDDFTYLDAFSMNDLESDSFFPIGDGANILDQHSAELSHQVDLSAGDMRLAPVQDPNDTDMRDAVNIPALSSTTPRSNGSSLPENHIEGEFYVDGQPARLPRVKRRRITMSTPVTTRSDDHRPRLELDKLNSVYDEYTGPFSISEDTYKIMQNSFNHIGSLSGSNRLSIIPETCSSNVETLFSEPFEQEFTAKKVFERLIESYMNSFHQLMPVLHVDDVDSMEWQIILPVASIGARLLDDEGATILADSLNELTRRSLLLTEESVRLLPASNIIDAQSRLLYLISSTYSNNSTLLNHSVPLPPALMNFCSREWTYNDTSDEGLNINERWSCWKLREKRRRTGYAIWLLDFMFAIHFQQPPLLSLANAEPQLPCCEMLWQAKSAQEWHDLIGKAPQPASMNSTLQQLYVEKSLPEGLGEFSRILLIHGLFRRMSETELYLANPLNHWTPSAQIQSVSEILLGSNVWMPSLPAFAKWRNSTCDCLDVLHWSANATIGLASGIEHPTVLHLHFARVVLLTPYQSIVAFAKHLAQNGTLHSDTAITHDRTNIRRWAVQDQYKARLAMIHAGVLFWHVRRYSANAFYESTSVALATLALWAFCTFTPFGGCDSRADEAGNAQPETNESDPEENFYDIILLDRPTDDELVQQFVREGNKMRANMNGVGDLRAEGASRKVLIEGRRLLRSITTWGSCETWITLIDRLVTISKS